MRAARYLAAIFFLLLLKGQPPAASNSYADPKLCASCHADIARTYARTGMARSFYRLDPRTATENYTRGNPFHHQASDTWYSMQRRGDRYFQKRWRLDPAGREIEVQESAVDYVMGSGNHARTYLSSTPRGALVELPLAWYPENGGGWAIGPGKDRDYVLPPRTIAYECMFCHNAYPKVPAGHDEPGSEPLYARALPEGIDCQRCHGPGSNHIRAAQTAGPVAEIRGAIVNPARLTPARQMEVCLQCHLETTSLELPHSLRRYGTQPFAYRPGAPLGDFLLFFDHAPSSKYRDDFEIAHSAYRLRQSRCFLRSDSRLTCTTCHNPHDIPRGPEATAHYNSVCRNCHASISTSSVTDHAAQANCVGCHMPRRRTQDVVHAVMTDHLIQRRAPSDPLAPIAERQEFDANQYRGDVVPYYPSPLPRTAENALYVAVAQVTQKSNLAKGLPQLAALIAAQKPARAEFYVELGQAWLSAGKPVNAIAAFEEAAKRRPDSAVVALNLADALTQSRQPARAIAILKRATQLSPDDPLLRYQEGIAHTALGHDAESIASLRKSVSLDPSLAEPHNLLGEALAASGDLEAAGAEFRAALEIHPDLPEAQGNLAHLLAGRGDLPQAAFYFAHAVRLKPADADLRVNYAVTLAGLNQFEGAQEQIAAALKIDPKSADAHNFNGTLLEHAGYPDAALGEFQEALRLRPDFPLARRNAARLLERRAPGKR